jgi:DNA-binding protein H-NS
MPRPSKLASLSIAKIFELQEEIAEHLAQRRKSLEQEIIRLDSCAIGVIKRSPMAGVKVAPKYRGPKGETWAGRGVYPTWLAALLKAGHKIEEFAIGAAKPAVAAARKKLARKVARKPARRKAAKRKG